MTLKFNEEFAINPQSAESGEGGGGGTTTTIYLTPNYTKTGSYSDNAGVVKTYGAAGYPTSTVKTPSSGTYEINVNFNMPSSAITSDSPILQVNNGDVYVSPNMKLRSWTGSAGAGGNTVLEVDKNYSFKMVRGSSNTTVYLKSGLPTDNLSDYSEEYTITNYSDNSYIKFLIFGSNQFWAGSVDMKYCNIIQNGAAIWSGCTQTIVES